ncbi:phosphatidylinositol-specific phospholipase C domain-containing protein [Chryseobacterium vaccae]|uniref:phosphatidylinositol-specific phospholipase C domain-containing protein n=1 Tax=Chryseobacterium vaccae TaxID=2604424 RepID=UPI001297A532|nr:phosphatidylinositol-specific phospholipase C domain-containing protein [Chryseobacterium vaccae]
MKTFSQNWMSHLPNHLKITDLTIPGTHDSGTYPAWDSSYLTKCQSLNISEQLNAGIRFLDIRLKRGTRADKDHVLWVYHGIADMDISFSGTIMNECQKFLSENPGETILMSIKNESDPDSSKDKNKFYDDLTGSVNIGHFPGLFYTENRIPALSEVKGKIVLLRRFGLGDRADIGIDLYDQWPHDSTKEFSNHGIALYVQDRYDDWKDDIEDKFIKAVKPVLEKASSSLPDSLFINFTSGTSGNIFYEGPRGIAEIVNRLFFNYLYNKPKSRYGIIPMDFPEIPQDKALINRLFSCNPFSFSSETMQHGQIYEVRTRLDLNKCMDVNQNSQQDGTPIIVHTANGQPNQRWKLEAAGDGYFYLHAQNTPDSVLDVNGLGKTDGTAVILQKKNGGDNQKWKINRLENGYFTLNPKHISTMSLDLFGASTENGSLIKIFQASTGDWAEQWAFIPVR